MKEVDPMKIKRIMAIALSVIAVSCLMTGCKEAAGAGNTNAANGVSSEENIISDVVEIELDLNDYDPSTASESWRNYDEQITKYGKMLPTDYADIPREMTYGIMTDIDGLMVSHMKYVNNGEPDIYTDSEGKKNVELNYLDMQNAKLVFEDGSAALKGDLTPGTAVLIKYDAIEETYPACIHCTKIVIPG